MDEMQITRDIILNENRITHLRKLASKLGVKSVSKIKNITDLHEMCMKMFDEKEETFSSVVIARQIGSFFSY